MVLRSVPHPPGHAADNLGVNTKIRPIPFVNMSSAASTSPKSTPVTSVMTIMDARMNNALKYHLPTTYATVKAKLPSAASQLVGRVCRQTAVQERMAVQTPLTPKNIA